MSLLDAFMLDPHPFEVWIAYRIDGVKGSGTLSDQSNTKGPLSVVRSSAGAELALKAAAFGTAFRITNTENLIARDNVIGLSNPTPIRFHDQGTTPNRGQVHTHGNVTPGGKRIEGVDHITDRPAQDVGRMVDDALAMSLL